MMAAHRTSSTAFWRRQPIRVTGVAAAFFTVLVVFAGAAFAYWHTGGSGSGTATLGTLNPPTGVSVPGTSSGPVSVSWTASTGTPAPTGYYVTRIKSDNTTANACGTTPTSTIPGTSCTDSVPTSGSYTYKVTAVYHSWTATSAASGTVVVTIATATKLAFTTQPTTTQAGSTFTAAVTVEDASNNPVQVPGRSVTIAIGTNPGGGTLGGTLTVSTNASGVATFSNLSINKTGNGYTLAASSSGLTGATSTTFNITPGAISALAFGTQPSSSATGGTAFSTQPTVRLQDANGNNVTTGGIAITLAITAPANGATLTCTQNTVNTAAGTGIATFAGCSIDKASATPYTLTATSTGLTTAQSNGVTVSVGAAAKLGFTTSPNSTTGGAVFTNQPVVVVQDAGGNTVTTSSASITLAITVPASGATLTCTNNTVSASSGIATFAGCAVDKIGTYTLTATSGALTGTSASFTITTGAAAKLCFYGGTSGVGTACLPASLSGIARSGTFTGQVHLVDAGGNDVNATSAITVTVAVSGGQFGNPSPTLVTINAGSAVSGNFTFSTPSGNGKTGTLAGTPSTFTLASVALST